LFGVAWVVVSEVSPLAPPSDEEDQVVEAYSTTGFQRNEEEEE
jgi:hypothetical protein